jgi:IS1 family transposase
MLDRSSIRMYSSPMNQISTEDRARVIACLVEGNSLRATTRMTGVHRTTVMKLLADLGQACSEYQDKAFRNLACKRIQCDEIWNFVGAKEINVPRDEKGQGRGDVWTWTAIDPETKLVPCWYIGNRDGDAAYHFMHDLAGRLANRVQLTTDAHRPYLTAVDEAFGTEIDYAQLVKFTATPKRASTTRPFATRPPFAWERRKPSSRVVQLMSTFLPVSASARILTCGWECAASLASRMPSQRRSRTTSTPLRSTSCTTIFAAFTRACALLPRWKRALRIMFGAWKRYWRC